MAHWRDRAACKGKTDLFFNDERGAPSNRAVLLCAGCPVSVECLEYALNASTVTYRGDGQAYERQLVGIWGGLTRRERGRLLAQREKAAG